MCGEGKVRRRLCPYFYEELFCFSMKRFVLGQFGARLQSPVAVTLRKSQKRETAAVNTVSPCDARLLQPWTGNTWLAPSMKLWTYLPNLHVRLGSQHPSRGVSDHPNFTDGRI